MNNYNLIMRLQAKMQNPRFADRFNRIASELNNIPGVQQEILRIAQMDDEKKREKAISRLPDRVKQLVREIVSLLND